MLRRLRRGRPDASALSPSVKCCGIKDDMFEIENRYTNPQVRLNTKANSVSDILRANGGQIRVILSEAYQDWDRGHQISLRIHTSKTS